MTSGTLALLRGLSPPASAPATAPMADKPAPPAGAAQPHGTVESWTDTHVWGWAIDPARPHEPLSVELWDGEQLILRTRADLWRPDVAPPSGAPGLLCGFNIAMPQHLLIEARHILHLRIAGQSEDLANSPLVLDNPKPPLRWEELAALLPKLEARASAATSAAEMRDLVGPVMATLGAMLPRYTQLAAQAGEDRAQATIDLAFSFSDRLGAILQDFCARYPRLSFPDAPDPEVSVIIPVHGKFAYTYQCLASILKALPRTGFEVIVVDDASMDETLFLPSVVSGALLYLRSPRNGGFIASCNAGAAAARGRYLLFLNNDTEVRDGWLDALRDTFAEVPDAGLVGSKLIFPDGSVQEAGGIVWRLGDGWNYGRGSQPDDPRISYMRDVDYVSGASIMVPRPVFEALGGFDTHYSPAYYEDTDLAFRIRQRGLRVLYQPLSELVHHEGITSGTDVKGTGAKRYQLANGRKFFDRWRDALFRHRLNGDEPELAKERGITRRILFIDETTPTPQEDAGSVAAVAHMRAMQALGAKITFVPADNMAHLGTLTQALQRIGIECLHHPWYWSLEEVIRKRGAEFDAVFLHRFVNAFKYAGLIRSAMPKARIIYSVADLHHLRLEREAAITGSPAIAKEAAVVKAREVTALSMADQVIVHSTHEAAYLAGAVAEERLNVIPWTVKARPGATSFADRQGITYLGGYRHTPNVDAVTFFVEQVMPHLRPLLPGIVFRIAGSHMPDSFHRLAAPDVHLEGFVPELGPYLDRQRLMVAPLRYGAGVKGKVLESLAHGLPCVATTMAAEGMGLTHAEDIALADEPRAIAEAIAWLYQDEAAWQRLRANGLAYLERTCGDAAINSRFRTLFDRLA